MGLWQPSSPSFLTIFLRRRLWVLLSFSFHPRRGCPSSATQGGVGTREMQYRCRGPGWPGIDGGPRQGRLRKSKVPSLVEGLGSLSRWVWRVSHSEGSLGGDRLVRQGGGHPGREMSLPIFVRGKEVPNMVNLRSNPCTKSVSILKRYRGGSP